MIPKKTIFLVVDDFESMRNMISNQIRTFGAWKVLKASNGQEALDILKDAQVNIVLSDWNMPVMTGIDLLKAIRANEKLYHMPFVMITAEAKREQVEDAINSGVSDLILKPYTLERLHDRVVRALTWKPRTGVMEIKKPSASNEEAVQPKQREVSRPTILVVDDTPENLQLISGLFKDDYRVRVANNGEKALEIVQSDNPPDLVLLDIMMPGIDGFEVFKRMREHSNSENIPVIFVTAMTGEEALVRGLEMGAIDYVTKPIDPDILKMRVRNFMNYNELYRRLQDDYDLMLETAKLRDDVEHIVRHDMKGPLAGVIGLVQDLAADDRLSRLHVEKLRIVEETALQALNIINLSSELLKIETGRFELKPQPLNVADILRRICEILQTAFASKHVKIELKIDSDRSPQASGDPMLCYSLFQNLIKNACEAATAKSDVTVTVKGEDPVKINIKNSGVVPAAIRERFFDKFVTHGKQGGTGLGTYSARMLTEAQNGKIEMNTSDKENETEITVSLPGFTAEK